MRVYRIDKGKYIQDFPPRGSLFQKGRWNDAGQWVVYTSGSIALAMLEILANSPGRIPSNRFLRIINVSDNAPLVNITKDDLPPDWDSIPYPETLPKTIKKVESSGEFIGAIVPSAISPMEQNVILFAAHPQFSNWVKQIEITEIVFNERLKA